MSKEKNINGPKLAQTTTSNLPGLRGVQIIVSKPILLKENSSKVVVKK